MTEAEFIKRIETVISTASTAAEMAKKIDFFCRKAAKEWDMNPTLEVAIRRPGQVRHHPDIDCWSVAFEAGPHEWAVKASLNAHNKCAIVEPYYGFDLCISDNR